MPRDRTATYKRIIRCMKEEFLTFGYEKASLNRVSSKVGITTAGLLLSPIIILAFRRIQAPGAAVCLFLGMLLLLLIINDAVMWHVVPLIVITVLAEAVRGMTKYSWSGDTIAAVLMSFSSFGYYGQIWFNRAYTYECAVEEMPAGYGDTLMSVSPAWTFPVVVIIGIIMSILISNVFMKKRKAIEK